MLGVGDHRQGEVMLREAPVVISSVSWPRGDLLGSQAFPKREGKTGAASGGVSPVEHREGGEETKGSTRPSDSPSKGSLTEDLAVGTVAACLLERA